MSPASHTTGTLPASKISVSGWIYMADQCCHTKGIQFLGYWKAGLHTLDVRGYSLNHSLLLACFQYLFVVPWNFSVQSPCTQPGLTGRVPSSHWGSVARWPRELRDSASWCSGDTWTCRVRESNNPPWRMWRHNGPVATARRWEETSRRDRDRRRWTRHSAGRQSKIMQEQECIPVGCVPPTFPVLVEGGVPNLPEADTPPPSHLWVVTIQWTIFLILFE